jgi:hypothetical protein
VVWYRPKSPSTAIINKLNQEINAALAHPQDHDANYGLGRNGGPWLAGRLRLIVEDTEKWAKVIRPANIRPQ